MSLHTSYYKRNCHNKHKKWKRFVFAHYRQLPICLAAIKVPKEFAHQIVSYVEVVVDVDTVARSSIALGLIDQEFLSKSLLKLCCISSNLFADVTTILKDICYRWQSTIHVVQCKIIILFTDCKIFRNDNNCFLNFCKVIHLNMWCTLFFSNLK